MFCFSMSQYYLWSEYLKHLKIFYLYIWKVPQSFSKNDSQIASRYENQKEETIGHLKNSLNLLIFMNCISFLNAMRCCFSFYLYFCFHREAPNCLQSEIEVLKSSIRVGEKMKKSFPVWLVAGNTRIFFSLQISFVSFIILSFDF